MPEIDLNAPILHGVENRTIVVNDNLPALRALPDACVDLIYLDPPFNSGRAYLNPIGLDEQEERGLLQDIRLPAPMERRDPQVVQERLVGFVDVFTMEPGDPNWKEEWTEEIGEVIPSLPPILEGAGQAHSPSMQGYLTFMAVRLVEMQRILKPTGSIYLHCDPTASHYLKSIMDSVFGAANFRNEIVWHYAKWSNVIGYFQRNHDVILYYSKNSRPVFHRQFSLSTDKRRKLEVGYQVNRPGGIKQLIVYDREKAAGKIAAGDYDRVVYRDDEDAGAPLHDTWHDINILNSQAKERTGYPTQKPLALLERIGPDVMANAQLLCGHCNERKGVRTMPELWKMTRDKGLLVNQRQVELLYRERDAERMADEAMMKPGIRELWQLPEG